MNCPFTMLLGVKGASVNQWHRKMIWPKRWTEKNLLYKPPQDTSQFVMLQDFWNMRKNEFLTQSITLGSFVRWWSRERNELDLQCGLTWWNEQPDPSPVSPVNIHDLCIASCWLERRELRWLCACRLTMPIWCRVVQTRGLLVWHDRTSSNKRWKLSIKMNGPV